MAIINTFMIWLSKKRVYQIDFFKKYPIEMQEELLKKLISSAKNTDWGKLYDYKSIISWENFNERVPVNDYDSLKPYIERLRKGEQNVLWPSDIKWFAKSSGTTSDKSKYIPVSVESITECHYKGGKDMLAIYCDNYPDTNVFGGSNLALGGSQQINEYNTDAYYGDLSAIIIENLPFWAELYRVPKREIATMGEWEEKLAKMVETTINSNVASIAGVPSWMLLLLRRILEYTNKKDIKEVWPNLEVYFHGGVSFDPYVEQFNEIISGNMRYVNTYNASEGFFGIQDQKDSDDLLLMLDYGVYYEFISLNEAHSDNPKVIPLQDVELGKNYAMVISTNAGLWRYKIGDTVMFTSLFPYRIKITGRTKNFINVCGEEVIVDNANNALRIACEKTHAIISEYTAAPLFCKEDKSTCHQWLIEFRKSPQDIEYFTEIFDNALKSFNSDYEAKRYHDMILKKPHVIEVAQGTFYEWLKKKNRLGGQYKVPRLSNDRKHIDEILTIIQ